MSNMKKLMLGVSAAVISLTCALATSAVWRVKQYHTEEILIEPNGLNKVAVTYEWYDDATGLASGIEVRGGEGISYGLQPFAVITYGTPEVERDWPNREFVRIYATGQEGMVDTKQVMYNGIEQNLEYRDPIYGWELERPHRLYTRRQANINGEWVTNGSYPINFTGDFATVRSEYNNFYGFGFWRVDGNNITLMHRNLAAYATGVDSNIDAYALTKGQRAEVYNEVFVGSFINALMPNAVTDLTTYNADGTVDVKQQRLFKVKRTYNLVIAGPEYAFDGTKVSDFGLVCNAATYNVNLLANFGVTDLVRNITGTVYNPATGTQVTDFAYANVRWVDAGYETAAPYRCYQVLEVDGVLLDGRFVGEYEIVNAAGIRTLVRVNRPYVYRYTGFNASPVVMNTYTNVNIDRDRYLSTQNFLRNSNPAQ